MTAASNPRVSHTFLSVLAALPLVICVRDTFFSLCKVQGSSMEPSLKDGDLLLIRKADFPVLRRLRGNSTDHDLAVAKERLDRSNQRDNDAVGDDINKDVTPVSDLLRRSRRLREYEYQQHLARESAAVWIRSPPWPLKGQIVTYKSPNQFPTEVCVKRVVGLSGQVVETTEGLQDVDMNCVWVEGDNHTNSSDSRDHGPVNQKLVMGVAEYVLWPPSRMGKLQTQVIDEHRSYWI